MENNYIELFQFSDCFEDSMLYTAIQLLQPNMVESPNGNVVVTEAEMLKLLKMADTGLLATALIRSRQAFLLAADELANAEKVITDQDDKIMILENKVDEKELITDDLEAQVVSQEEDYASIVRDLNTSLEEVEYLKNQVDSLELALDDMEADCDDLRSEVADLTEQLDDLEV